MVSTKYVVGTKVSDMQKMGTVAKFDFSEKRKLPATICCGWHHINSQNVPEKYFAVKLCNSATLRASTEDQFADRQINKLSIRETADATGYSTSQICRIQALYEE